MTSHDQTFMNSAIGKIAPDGDSSPIGLARIAPDESYSGIGDLLQEHINNSDQVIWRKIKEKIDYTYDGIDLALEALRKETRFHIEIESRLEKGQKLLFKPNIVSPVCINPQSHDPGMGSTACTEWAFVAALMRWFHDKLKISYYQMAVGEASTMMSSIAAFFSMMNPDSQSITPEAVMEGKSGTFFWRLGILLCT